MKPFRISRRALLRGAGGVAIGLPFLEIMTKPGRAAAQSAAGPKRFVTFFSSAGNVHDVWVPTGSSTSLTLGSSRILKPLEPFQSKIVVLDGLTNFVAATAPGVKPGDDHMKGIGTLLTQRELQPGNTASGCTAQGFSPAGLASGISLDQEIANQFGAVTRFKSLELGVQTTNSNDAYQYTSFSGPGMANPSQDDPSAVFQQLTSMGLPMPTGTTMGPDPAAQLRAQQRKSVLDAVIDSYASLSPRLGKIDKVTMDAHMSAIRDLEQRLTIPPPTGGGGGPSAACTLPMAPGSGLDFPSTGKAQMDLLALALACDLTRVATLQWEYAMGEIVFSWLSGAGAKGHHAYSHDDDSAADSQEALAQINVWYAQQFLYLLQKLDSIQEGNGTVLDNTVVFWGNELAKGNIHSHYPMSFVLAGGAGAIKGGRFLTYQGAANPHSPASNELGGSQANLLVSMANAVGVPMTTFGDPMYCTGPLAGL